jgi:predicted AlkP superfamily phosphohydrolase/phosphomutase
MVQSLIGRADNHQLVFNKVEGERWEAIVPSDLDDGTYVIELWATDEYGNTSYYTGIFYLFDGRSTYLEVIEDDFHAVILNDKHNLELTDQAFGVEIQVDKYNIECSERMVVVM